MNEHYTEIRTIKYATALELVQTAMRIGQNKGVKAVVSVCNPEMSLIAYGRADGSTPHSAETSRRKANTSASSGRVTGWMGPELSTVLPLGANGLITNIKGGVPIYVDGVLIGGLGVAGGPPEDDQDIALETLKELGFSSEK